MIFWLRRHRGWQRCINLCAHLIEAVIVVSISAVNVASITVSINNESRPLPLCLQRRKLYVFEGRVLRLSFRLIWIKNKNFEASNIVFFGMWFQKYKINSSGLTSHNISELKLLSRQPSFGVSYSQVHLFASFQPVDKQLRIKIIYLWNLVKSHHTFLLVWHNKISRFSVLRRRDFLLVEIAKFRSPWASKRLLRYFVYCCRKLKALASDKR